MRYFLLFALLLLVISPAQARSREVLPGPIPAIVEKVIDGDTLRVRARIWVGQDVHVLVRIEGVDTPELSGRCADEKTKAYKARKFVARMVAGQAITLTHIRLGKYAGRVIAKITMPNGGDLGALLLKTGHAKPYVKRRYQKWCCDGGRCEMPSRYSKFRQ